MKRLSVCACVTLLLALSACLEDPEMFTMHVSGIVDDASTGAVISGAKVHLSAGHLEDATDWVGGGSYKVFRSAASSDGVTAADGSFDISVEANVDDFFAAHITVTAPGYQTYDADLERTKSLVLPVTLQPVSTP